MTDPVVRIEDVRLAVEPGGQVQTVITIKNDGDIVEGYLLEVLGEGPAGWAQVLPNEVQVYPGSDATAVLVFNPPSDAAAGSGSFPFAVLVKSVVDETSTTVVEGDLDLGRVFGLQSKMTPVTSTGRWTGKHLVEFTNWGNAPVRLKVAATDPDEKLAFMISPEILEVPIGGTSKAAMRVKTRKPFLRGQPVRLPFQITAEPDPPEPAAMGPAGPLPVIADPRRAAADGAFNQRPILSRLVVVLGVLALAGIGAGLFFALKSTPATAAPAALGTGVPLTPALTVAAGSDSTVVLQWENEPSLDPYKLYTVTAEGRTSAVVAVDGALNTFTVTGLTPGTKYCFRLQAVRGKTASGLSEPQCAETAAAVATSSSGPATVTLTGSSPPVSGGQTPTASVPPTVVSSGGASSPANSGPASPVIVVPPPPPPPTGGGSSSSPAVSVPSSPGGSTAATPPTSGSAAGSSSAPPPSSPVTTPGTGLPGTRFKPNQFIGVLASIPNVEPSSLQSAMLAQQRAVAAGLPAQLLRTSDHPDLRLFPGSPAPQDAFLVWVGPFESRADSDVFCTSRPGCLSVQPDPKG